MENTKGYKYMIEGFSDIDKFAKGILTLVNAKSSISNSIVDIKTFSGTNNVQVISLSDIGMDLVQTMGQITSESVIDILTIEFDDLNDDAQKTIVDLEENDPECFLRFIELR